MQRNIHETSITQVRLKMTLHAIASTIDGWRYPIKAWVGHKKKRLNWENLVSSPDWMRTEWPSFSSAVVLEDPRAVLIAARYRTRWFDRVFAGNGTIQALRRLFDRPIRPFGSNVRFTRNMAAHVRLQPLNESRRRKTIEKSYLKTFEKRSYKDYEARCEEGHHNFIPSEASPIPVLGNNHKKWLAWYKIELDRCM